MTAETVSSREAQVGHAADASLHDRRKLQDRRLRKWGKWFSGGLGMQALGVGAAFIPFVGFPLAVSLWAVGGVAEGIGTVGIIGNIVKGNE